MAWEREDKLPCCELALFSSLTSLPSHSSIVSIIMVWSGEASVNGQTAPAHSSVLAPTEPIEPAPQPGPLVFLPEASAGSLSTATQAFQKAVASSGINIQEKVDSETRGVIWLDHSPQHLGLLQKTLEEYQEISWIQMPVAGVNAYSDLIKKENKRVWTSAKVSIQLGRLQEGKVTVGTFLQFRKLISHTLHPI